MKRTHLLATATSLAVCLAGAGAQTFSTVQFSSPRYAVKENQGAVTLTVERIGEPDGTAYVEYGTSYGSATNGVDFTEQNGILFFFGETNLTITVPILNDSNAERDKTFFVTLFNPDWFDTLLGSVTSAEVTLWDDDRGVEFSAQRITVGEGAGNAVLTVHASTESTNPFSVDYFTGGCDAMAGADFLPQSGTLRFAAGETEKTVHVSILDDTSQEESEALSVTLSNPSGVELKAWQTAVVIIEDDDATGWTNVPDLFWPPQRKGIWSGPTGVPLEVVVDGRYAYYRTVPGDLEILDISNPALPTRVGGCRCADEGGFPFAVAGRFAYLGGYALQVVDVSDPANPVKAGRVEAGVVEEVVVSDGYAFVADWYYGLRVFTLSDPARPVEISGSRGEGYTVGAAVAGPYVYLSQYQADGQNLRAQIRIIDISDPAHPAPVAEIETGGIPRDVALFAQYLFVPSHRGGVEIFDLSAPRQPVLVTTYAPQSETWRLAVAGTHAYLLDYNGLQVVDLANPGDPQPVGSYVPGGGSLAVVGHRAFITGARGLEVLDISEPTRVRRLGGYEVLDSPRGVAVSGQYAFVADGVGLRVFDIGDRSNPRLVGRAAVPGGSAEGILIQCNMAMVMQNPGFSIFDLSQPTLPQRIGGYPGSPSSPWWTSLTVEGTRAYLFARGFCDFGCVSSQVEIVDVSDSAEPRSLGSVALAFATDIAVSGRYLYAANYWDVTGGRWGLAAIDIGDPLNPRLTSVTALPAGKIAVAGRHAYVTSADFSGRHLGIVDISNPADLRLVGNLAFPGTGREWLETLKVVRGYAYLKDSGGLTIFDVRDSAHPRLVSYYEARGGPFAVFGDEALLISGGSLEVIDLNPLGILPDSFIRLADGQVRFTLSTRPGHHYTVETSTNLVTWNPLETRTATGTRLDFADPNAASFSRRFYRAVSP